MKQVKLIKNNKGFSLIEFIVVIAIMSITVGALSLSVSILTGSEAKKAFQKMEAVLDEARTGSMTRFNETLTISYLTGDASYDVATDTIVSSGDVDSDGYYAVLTMYAIKAAYSDAEKKHPVLDGSIEMANKEYRRLADGRAKLAIECVDSTGVHKYEIGDSSSDYIKFEFDRSTGLYKQITVKNGGSVKNIVYDSVARQFDVKDELSNVEVYITAHSGVRTYKMQLVGETGKHIRVND